MSVYVYMSENVSVCVYECVHVCSLGLGWRQV